MRYLIDTHVWLWLLTDSQRIRADLRAELADPSTERVLSAASSWEIAIKSGSGRLELPEPPERYVPDRMRRSAVTGLAVTHAHALRVATLPPHHRDPFDRLLIAQAQIESIPIVTVDAAFRAYDVTVIDASG